MDISLTSHADLDRGMRAARDAGLRNVALLPTGACEQHGPFLPLGTDTAIARAVAERIDAMATEEGAIRAWRFPAIDYAPCKTATSYTGTVSMAQDAFRGQIQVIFAELLRQGFDAIAVVNAHGTNTPSLQEEAYEFLDSQFRYGVRPRRPALILDTFKAHPAIAQRWGLPPGAHADWVELLGAMAVYGPAYFTEERLAAYREWGARATPPTFSAASIVGIPIEHRSTDGVRGHLLPPEGDWWALSREAMETVCLTAYRTLTEDLAAFWKQFNS